MNKPAVRGPRSEVGNPGKNIRRSNGNKAGMTLVEVLLAVVILGIALGGLLQGASEALAVVRQARNYEMARRMLGRVDAENPLRLLDEIQAGQESGGFEGGPAGWSWTRSLEDLGADDDQKEGLFLMTTRVFWGTGERKSSEEAVQYLYVPKNSDGVRTLKPKVL